MLSSEDLERFYFQYQTEAVPLGMSVQTFCLRNNVPYNIFTNGTSGSVPSDPKAGGPMLSVTGMNRFYYLRGFTDMRCKHSRVLSVIREQLHREPSDGDIYIVMSKDRRIVRLFAYDNRSYSLFEKSLLRAISLCG